MKKFQILVLTSLLTSGSLAFADDSSLNTAGAAQIESPPVVHNSIGLGLAYNQNIYEGVGNVVHPFPLLNLSYEDFFLKGFTAGYNVYQDASTSFAFVVQPMFGGYSADDSSALDGMNGTSYLMNTGVQMQYRLMPFSLTVAGLHDITGRTTGNSASAKIAATVPLDDKRFVLIPSITAAWESSDITNYYYGVTSGEATSTRPEYNPASAWNMEYGLTFKYEITEHFGATLGYTFTKYANTISDSPIVSRSSSSAILTGISYIF
jgi:outer membrane protein